MSEQQQFENQRELVTYLLDKGLVQVVIDARIPGVCLPPQFKDSPAVALNLSHRFSVPLVFSSTTVCASLSFHGRVFDCTIPWDAVWRVTQYDRSYMFPAAVPEEIKVTALTRLMGDKPVREEAPKKTQLRLVMSNSEDEVQLSPPRTGHLRLVQDGRQLRPAGVDDPEDLPPAA